MKKVCLVGAGIFAMVFALVGVTYATTMQYSGKITSVKQIDYPGPGNIGVGMYGKVGDTINIQVGYDLTTMVPSQILIQFEAWGDMNIPITYWLSFSDPDNWFFSSGGTSWGLSGSNFLLISDNWGGEIKGQVVPVPEPSTMILVVIGLVGFTGVVNRRKIFSKVNLHRQLI